MKTVKTPLTALVPIKGASERVPGKNLRDFCGWPLMCRVLGILQEVDVVDRIVVNTDSDKVADIAQSFPKVLIHKRPANLCGHTVPMNHVLAHDLSLLGVGHYLQTHVTNPLLKTETIEDAVKEYFAAIPEYDSLFSVARHQSRFYDADIRPLNHNPDVLLNTQDLPPLFEENSCLYIFSDTSFFAHAENRVGRHAKIYVLSKIESLDIDTEDDFRFAEIAWKAFRRG
jgi:CMP-N-acetylneuraminic acid synthetase